MPKERKNCLMCHMTINRKVHSPKNTKKNLYLIKKNCFMPKEHKTDQKNYKGREKRKKINHKEEGIQEIKEENH